MHTPSPNKHYNMVDTTRPQNDHWRRDLESEMESTGFNYSWRKMEAAAAIFKTELDGENWSAVSAPLEATR